MPVLTLEAIRQNPWNVLTHDLPAEPSRLLLNVAQLAAATCRQIESDLFATACDEAPDSPLDAEARDIADRFFKANRKIGEICCLLEEIFGVVAEDYLLPRNSA
jgi:hypothetical protein